MENLFEKVQNLLKEGKTRSEIAIILDCQKSVVNYYANPKNWEKFLSLQQTRGKKLNFEKSILEVIDQATSLSNICDLIGIHRTNVNIQRIAKFLEEKGINPEWKQKQANRKPQGYWNKDNIFTENSSFPRSKLKDKLIEYRLKEHKCEICGNSEWLNHSIPLQIHHINGVNNDNRLENLQILCPNCHALTDNYCGKNINYSTKESKELKNKIVKKPSYKDVYSKEFLEAELNSEEFTNFDDLAKKLNMGRKTLQKLCRDKGLPGSKTEMGIINKEKIEEVVCECCGKVFKPAIRDAKYCSKECARKAINPNIPNELPSREAVLKEVVSVNTMSELAKVFGYKDMRSPCKKLGLPITIKELKELI